MDNRTLELDWLTLSPSELEEVVEGNDKRRFAFDETGTRIRASQGHSVGVELGLTPAAPPEALYHGRTKVGAQRGKPVILAVDSGAMAKARHMRRLP
jgi:putative RNA 2'-phosphotransferase